MKISVCDVCWPKETRQANSHWRVRSGGESYRLDICDEHKNFITKRTPVGEAMEKVKRALGVLRFSEVEHAVHV